MPAMQSGGRQESIEENEIKSINIYYF